MAKFFGNIWSVFAVSIILLIGIMYYFHGGTDTTSWLNAIFRFLHVLVGVLWIGLLYYFNLVQIPTMPKVPAELKPGVSKYIAPEALFWFRWAAAITVLFGLIIAAHPPQKYLVEALTFAPGYRLIGIGMWLGLIMAFNVWFVIWPNQKRALGIVEADADVKAKSATTAMMFSRTNALLSVPMLYCMVTQGVLGGS